MQVTADDKLLFAPGKKHKRLSTDRSEILQLTLKHLLEETANSVLLEMRRRAMVIQCSGVHILLIDNHHARIIPLNEVSDVADTSRLLPRGVRQVPQYSGHLFTVGRIESHPYGKAHHLLASYPLSAVSNSGSVIVCSRSGPVDTMPIFAPDSFSRNFR